MRSSITAEPQLLETGDLSLRKRLIRDVGEGRSTPERERRSKPLGSRGRTSLGERVPPLRAKTLALRRIEFVRRQHQPVTGGSARQTRGTERGAQARDVRPQGCLGRGRRLSVPEVVDQPIARDDLIGV